MTWDFILRRGKVSRYNEALCCSNSMTLFNFDVCF
jgi:hypothetical protein